VETANSSSTKQRGGGGRVNIDPPAQYFRRDCVKGIGVYILKPGVVLDVGVRCR